MDGLTTIEDEQLRIASRYSSALLGVGIQTTDGNPIFTRTESGWAVTEAARSQIAASEDAELATKIVQAGIDELNQVGARIEHTESFQGTLAALEDTFESHLALWRAMVASAKQGRFFLPVELSHYEQAIAQAQMNLANTLSQADRTSAVNAIAAHDRATKQRFGLLFDNATISDVNRLVGNVLTSRPTLIVGDKGIAKTQIAKFVASLYGQKPIVISVKGDMMSDELIGRIVHDKAAGSFIFQDGMILQAMKQGLPVLLDEINFGDQAIIARLQDILLCKPGETVRIQEAGAEPITVAPGFAVFATANEASRRYRHREILDPAIRDRFDIISRGYPDMETEPMSRGAGALMRMALASASDGLGFTSSHIAIPLLQDFVTLAHATQYLYSVSAKDVVLSIDHDRMTSLVLESDEPIMTDCLTPRTVDRTVSDCAQGNLPDRRLDHSHLVKLARSLDQAGSTANWEIARQVMELSGMPYEQSHTEEDTPNALDEAWAQAVIGSVLASI